MAPKYPNMVVYRASPLGTGIRTNCREPTKIAFLVVEGKIPTYPTTGIKGFCLRTVIAMRLGRYTLDLGTSTLLLEQQVGTSRI